MATTQGKRPDSGVVGRLAERGEDAVHRLVDELGKNPRVTEALHAVTSARGKLDTASKGALAGVGIASVDEVKSLKRKVAALEKRLAELEGSGGKKSAPKRAAAKRAPAKRTAKKAAASTVSPPAGAAGGGTARGSG